MSISIPSIAGPAIAGKIYEELHSYSYAFYFGGVACLIGALIQIFFIMCVDIIQNVNEIKFFSKLN